MTDNRVQCLNRQVFAGARPTPMIDLPGTITPNQRGAHPEASFWGDKGSWMIYQQVASFSAQARVILPPLYAPFGLPQPTVAVVSHELVQTAAVPRGFPSAREIVVVAKAWRQQAQTGWCGHLVVASAAEQSPARPARCLLLNFCCPGFQGRAENCLFELFTICNYRHIVRIRSKQPGYPYEVNL